MIYTATIPLIDPNRPAENNQDDTLLVYANRINNMIIYSYIIIRLIRVVNCIYILYQYHVCWLWMQKTFL